MALEAHQVDGFIFRMFKGFHFQVNFLINTDREFPTFTSVEGLKLGLYSPLSTFLMERSFHLLVNTSFCFDGLLSPLPH